MEKNTAIQQQEVTYGRSFNASDVDNHLYVAIVNPTVVRNVMRLENVGDAVGGEVYLKGIPFTVIGVLPEEDTDTGAFAIDMYRVENWEGLYSAGFFDYMDMGGVIAAEWSENIEAALPDDTIYIEFERLGDSERKITVFGSEKF